MKARAAAARVRAELEAAGIPDAAIEAEVLTRHASGLSRAAYFADAPVADGSCARLETLVERRLRREPTPYLTGTREFHGLEFVVGPGALIPRPETELLVELGLAELERNPAATVVDVDGSHRTMLDEPEVDDSARQLEIAFEEMLAEHECSTDALRPRPSDD